MRNRKKYRSAYRVTRDRSELVNSIGLGGLCGGVGYRRCNLCRLKQYLTRRASDMRITIERLHDDTT